MILSGAFPLFMPLALCYGWQVRGGEMMLDLKLLGLAVGLSMDAFAVALCKGLALGRPSLSASCLVGAWFGFFQALMPLVGFLLADSFASWIGTADRWIAFSLLLVIGGNMLREALCGGEDRPSADLGPRSMAVLAVATSIDALAAGISLMALIPPLEILSSVLLIGLVTFFLSGLGVYLGAAFGAGLGRKAEAFGGGILILLAIRILTEH